MRYEYYDREKDFSKKCYDSLIKHSIYPLSKEGLKKYLKHANYFFETHTNPYLTEEKKKQINQRNLKSMDFSNINKTNLNIIYESKINSEKLLKEENKNKELVYNYNFKKPKIQKEYIYKRNLNYFEPIIINRTLKNKYLIKGFHTNKSHSCKKLKIKELPLITYNKMLGKRKIEIENQNAYITTSTLGKPFTNHKSYYMGEKYNPQNYLLDRTKNRTSRNEFGALFSN